MEDVWDVQSTGGVKMDGVYRYMGCIDVGVLQTFKDLQTARHTSHVCQLHLGTIFLIKFKLVSYRHILLAHQFA